MLIVGAATNRDSVGVANHAPSGCSLLRVHRLPRVRLLWRELRVPCPNDRQLLGFAHSNALLLDRYSVGSCLVEAIADPALDTLVHDPLRLMATEWISVRGRSLRNRRLRSISQQLGLLLLLMLIIIVKECVAGTS